MHPVTSHAESVPTLDVLGSVTRILLDGKQTHGAFSLVEVILPPGGALPHHVHRREEETFHVLEGEVELRCGSHTATLRPGDSFFAPRGIPHSPRVTSATAGRMLITFTPAGFERVFREIDDLAAKGAVTPENVTSLLRDQYGCEFVPAD